MSQFMSTFVDTTEYVHNIKANDLKRIERMIAENTDIIINRWYELFKTADEDDK